MNGIAVVVSVGTDHHPFDRLVQGVAAWTSSREDIARLVVQHGYSAPSGTGEDHVLLDRTELLELYRTADVIVTQVGPGTISDVNTVGRRPLVVPRDPRLGEVVDDHQYAYGRLMNDLGYAWTAESTTALEDLMAAAVADPRRTHLDVAPPSPAAATTAFALVVSELMSRPRSSLSIRRAQEMLRRTAASPFRDHLTDPEVLPR